MNWSDLLVIGIIAGFALIGMMRGFVHSMFKLVSFFVSIFVSVQCYPILANILMKTALYTNIKAGILKNLLMQHEQSAPGVNSGAKKAAAESIVDSLSMPGFMKDSLRGTLENQLPDLTSLVDVSKIMELISTQMAKVVINIISLIILYILIRIGLIFVQAILKGLAKLPVFKQMDKFGGFAFGAIQGLLSIYILFAFVMLFNSLPQMQSLYQAIDSSLAAKFFYQNNFIVNWIMPK